VKVLLAVAVVQFNLHQKVGRSRSNIISLV